MLSIIHSPFDIYMLIKYSLCYEMYHNKHGCAEFSMVSHFSLSGVFTVVVQLDHMLALL